MIKKSWPWIVVIAMAIGAIWAVAGASNAGAAVTPGTFYPLTITAQQAMKVSGDSIAYKVTVTNTSPKLRFAPLVFLDPFGTVDQSNPPQVYTDPQLTVGSTAKLVTAYSPMFAAYQPAWSVGLLKPGQSKSLVIWYNSVVNFPGGSNSEYTWPPSTATMGFDYDPNFTLYDTFYKKATTAPVARTPFNGGGK